MKMSVFSYIGLKIQLGDGHSVGTKSDYLSKNVKTFDVWSNEHFSAKKNERLCVSGCVINLLCHMRCKDWRFSKFELGDLYPDFQSCVEYFRKTIAMCSWLENWV